MKNITNISDIKELIEKTEHPVVLKPKRRSFSTVRKLILEKIREEKKPIIVGMVMKDLHLHWTTAKTYFDYFERNKVIKCINPNEPFTRRIYTLIE